MRKFLLRALNHLVRLVQPESKLPPNFRLSEKPLDPGKKYRVALCFSGQIRHLDKGYEHIYKNILEQNPDCEIDVFIHCWFSREEIGKSYVAAGGDEVRYRISENVLTDIYKYYNPEKMLTEKQIIFDEKNYNQNKAAAIVPMFSLSKNYSMKRSLELKKQNELEKKFTYDYVMTLRFDLGISNPVVFRNFDPGAVTASEAGVSQDRGIDVTHSVMGSQIADIYGTFLDRIDQYYKEGIMFCDEPMMQRHLEVNNIKFIRTPSLNNYVLLR